MTLLVLGLLFGAAPAQAAKMITYEDALQAAVDANPSLVTARRQVEQAEAGVLGAQAIFDPNLDASLLWRAPNTQQGFFQGFPFESESRGWNANVGLGGSLLTGTSYNLNTNVDRNFSSFTTDFGGASSEQIQDAYSWGLTGSVTQQLLKGHRFAYNTQQVTQARSSFDQARLSVDQSTQQTLGDAAQGYWTWVYQERLAEIADESVSIAQEALRVGRLKLEAGEVAPVEATRLEAALVQARANAIDARNAADQSRDALFLLMGLPPGSQADPATKVGQVRALDIDLEAAVDVAMAQNLDVILARQALDTARIEHANAKHARLPTLSATLTAGARAQHTADEEGTNVVNGLADNTFPYWTLGSNLSVPLGNRAARGDTQRTAAVVYQREEELAALQRTIRSQVEQQVRTLRSSQQKVQLAEANLRLAQETLLAEEALAEAGDKVADGKDVLEARSEVDRTKAELAKARTDYRLAQVELLRLQGQLTVDLP